MDPLISMIIGGTTAITNGGIPLSLSFSIRNRSSSFDEKQLPPSG